MTYLITAVSVAVIAFFLGKLFPWRAVADVLKHEGQQAERLEQARKLCGIYECIAREPQIDQYGNRRIASVVLQNKLVRFAIQEDYQGGRGIQPGDHAVVVLRDERDSRITNWIGYGDLLKVYHHKSK